jgi:hypothetical protein
MDSETILADVVRHPFPKEVLTYSGTPYKKPVVVLEVDPRLVSSATI